MKNPLLPIESPLQDLNPVMGGWSEGGEWGLAKGSLDEGKQMVQRLDGRLIPGYTQLSWAISC